MKAIKVEAYIRPQFLKAALQYLRTDGTQFETALPNGLMVVTTDTVAQAGESVAQAIAYIKQYTDDTGVWITSSVNLYKE